MRDIAKHLVRTPLYTMILCCRGTDRPSCNICCRIPAERCEAADFLYNKWNGLFPLPVLRDDGHTTSLIECIERGGEPEVLEEFKFEYSCCKLCVYYWKYFAELKRHRQLRHPTSVMADLSDLAHKCSFKLRRELAEIGGQLMPHGEFRTCGMRFANETALQNHKEAEGHIKRRAPAAPNRHPMTTATTTQAPTISAPRRPRVQRKSKRPDVNADEPEYLPEPKRRRSRPAPLQDFIGLLQSLQQNVAASSNLSSALSQARFLLLGEAYVTSNSMTTKWRKALAECVSIESLAAYLSEVQEEVSIHKTLI